MKSYLRFLVSFVIALGLSSITACGKGNDNANNCNNGTVWNGSACVAAVSNQQLTYNGQTVSCPSGTSVMTPPASQYGSQYGGQQQVCGCPAGTFYVQNGGCVAVSSWTSYCQQLSCAQQGTYVYANGGSSGGYGGGYGSQIFTQCRCQ